MRFGDVGQDFRKCHAVVGIPWVHRYRRSSLVVDVN